MQGKNYIILLFFTGLTVLSGCSFLKKEPEPPRLKDLKESTLTIERDSIIETGRDAAIESYRAYLKQSSQDELRVEAMRRLADIGLENTEDIISSSNLYPDSSEKIKRPDKKTRVARQEYKNAVNLYENLLATYPDYSGNDGVLYQLARAHELAGNMKSALAVFDKLIKKYPDSTYYNEVQFRRGEILFVKTSYVMSEAAYAAVIARQDTSPFYERALYKHGWSLFKQRQYNSALLSFMRLLDRKLHVENTITENAYKSGLSRGEIELLDDTFRVVSLCFSYLGSADSIESLFSQIGPRTYDYLVYRNLGNLYLKQERIRDAADIYNAFMRRNPDHQQAPYFQLSVIDAYKKGNFPSLALVAKKEFVRRFNVKSTYWTLHGDKAKSAIFPHLKSNLDDLASYYHALAQKTKQSASYEEAALWYKTYLESFPGDPDSSKINFLLAEVLYESGNHLAAAEQYEKTAYYYPDHKKAAEAGYAALLAFSKYEEKLDERAKNEFHPRVINSSLRFASTYPDNPRTSAVLTKAAEDLFKSNRYTQSAAVAKQVINKKPAVEPDLRRTAWTVFSHSNFELEVYDQAENGYQEILNLMGRKDKARPAIVARLAASIYKQAEQYRMNGDHNKAVDYFLRIGAISPGSTIHATAEYDAAASLIILKQWPRAITVMESFRKSHPGHALNNEVTAKLAIAYTENQQPVKAAKEFEKIAITNKDQNVAKEAILRAAELYEKAGSSKAAVSAYKKYIAKYPLPLEPAMEVRNKLVILYTRMNQTGKARGWLKEIIKAELNNSKNRTSRTTFLAANASLKLATPIYTDFSRSALTIPLAKSLKIKKRKMKAALKAYEQAAAFGVEGVTTEATYKIAEIYNLFSHDLLASQRPKGLSKDELEQYSVLLEEQAYPFEEKAIQIHQANSQRAIHGTYDQWVKKSFSQLAKLLPGQYAKLEKAEDVTNAIQ